MRKKIEYLSTTYSFHAFGSLVRFDLDDEETDEQWALTIYIFASGLDCSNSKGGDIVFTCLDIGLRVIIYNQVCRLWCNLPQIYYGISTIFFNTQAQVGNMLRSIVEEERKGMVHQTNLILFSPTSLSTYLWYGTRSLTCNFVSSQIDVLIVLLISRH